MATPEMYKLVGDFSISKDQYEMAANAMDVWGYTALVVSLITLALTFKGQVIGHILGKMRRQIDSQFPI